MKMKGKRFGLIAMVLIGMLIIASPALTQMNKMKLVSVKADSAIMLDAVAEKAWEKATALEVKVDQLPYEPNNGYEGIRETKRITGSDIYFINFYFCIFTNYSRSKGSDI